MDWLKKLFGKSEPPKRRSAPTLDIAPLPNLTEPVDVGPSDQPRAKTSAVPRSSPSPKPKPPPKPAPQKLINRPRSSASDGRETQFPKVQQDASRLQLVIGLDFGTAYTKVVLGEVTRAYAVPFKQHAEKINAYLLPGVMRVGQDGSASLGEGGEGKTLDDLKMRLLDGRRDPETLNAIVAFLALVLRETRAWFLNHHQKTYERYRLDWCLNLGLPTHHYHDGELAVLYRKLAQAAWKASVSLGAVTISLANECFEDGSGSLDEFSIGLFPEFVAQVNSYVKSPMRRGDLHLLVDVGAGTVDMATFNVHENEEGDLFPIFAKSVSKLGVAYLNRSQDQSGFKRKLLDQVEADIRQVRTVKYPQFWEHGKTLPFFLCGGGANVAFYSKLAAGMSRDKFPCALDRLELPAPARLVAKGLPAGSYHRISVAYGLSFDPFDIGQIIPEDQTLDDAAFADPDKGGVCGKCGGTGGAHRACTACGGSGWVK